MGTIVPVDERSLVKGPAQLWLAKAGVALPALDEAADGIVSFNVQTITQPTVAVAFKATFDGHQTGTIANNAAASAVETALEGLPSIGEGNVEVVGDAGGPYTVTFLNWLRSAHLPLIQVDDDDILVERDWEYAGNTEAGLSVNEIESQEQHFADEHLGPIERSRTAEGIEISCNVINATLDKLKVVSPSGEYARNAPSLTKVGHETFSFGDGNHDPFFQALIFARNGMGFFYARHVFKVKPIRNGERSFQKGAMWYTPMNFSGYINMSAAPGARLYKDYNMTETILAE